MRRHLRTAGGQPGNDTDKELLPHPLRRHLETIGISFKTCVRNDGAPRFAEAGNTRAIGTVADAPARQLHWLVMSPPNLPLGIDPIAASKFSKGVRHPHRTFDNVTPTPAQTAEWQLAPERQGTRT